MRTAMSAETLHKRQAATKPQPDTDKEGWHALGLLVVGYIGVYLCRKNLSVAVPLLQKAFGVAAWSAAGVAVLVGLVGLLVYEPYSLLAGALAIESGGKEAAATAAGVIDGVGYVAAALAGTVLGRLLDVGGYTLGFEVLAGVTLVSAGIALGLRPTRKMLTSTEAPHERRAATEPIASGGV
jgi:sugar phosphate permease